MTKKYNTILDQNGWVFGLSFLGDEMLWLRNELRNEHLFKLKRVIQTSCTWRQ